MNTLEKCIADGVFPITFHNYSSWGSPAAVPEAVKTWTDLGLTVGRTPGYDSGKVDKADMLAILDACAEAGIKCFVPDRRAGTGSLRDADEDSFRRSFEEALKDFGSHPAAFGFDVGDEPARQHITPAFRTAALHREMAPHLTSFLSMGGYDPGAVEWMGIRSYGRYLDEYCQIAQPRMLFQNNYYALHEGDYAQDSYFRSHKMFTDSCKRNGDIPYWVTLCCSGHMNMRCPSEDDLRWQINTSAALGAKGFAWFLVYVTEPHMNYRLNPIDEHWERTETFSWLSRQLRTFQKWHGPTLMKLTFQKAFFCLGGGPTGGYPTTIDSELVKGVRVRDDKFEVLISEFKDADGRDYVAIVNRSLTGSGQAILRWHGKPKVFHVGWEGKQSEVRAFFDDDWPENPYLETGPWLAPGQMELYRVESDAPQRL
ncbi:hypothetical protein LCGC14_0124460 [marine sediment metagenome]|uniref:Glycoside hydrolase family 42 N-terminal domain-containing protein n=1 Tax=marine sediment metagenome TaxID=412755 RepID=A0A0F9XMQ2_9ZZZZ|nr:hypothetical protein [Phycisphaerae bacterium]HDZ42346.1 hypothetical protein [Phycisphaerae bacterium]